MATNGLLSFDEAYGPFFDSPFPNSGDRYLVAPFWDDADTTFGNGRVSYAVYESGYDLEYVSAFIRRRNPSDFRGTWMMVAFWDSVRPYHSFFQTQVCDQRGQRLVVYNFSSFCRKTAIKLS